MAEIGSKVRCYKLLQVEWVCRGLLKLKSSRSTIAHIDLLGFLEVRRRKKFASLMEHREYPHPTN